MQERHQDRQLYFTEQGKTTERYVIPYIAEVLPVVAGLRVLEIGCGEGGNLTPFVERGCAVTGVDINAGQIANARKLLAKRLPDAEVRLIASDIYRLTPADVGTFDLIFLRDVIEHIPDQRRFFGHLKTFLTPTGIVFFGFPPWRMPFGGHQQICRSKVLSKLPYFHLLPKPVYAGLLRSFGEPESTVTSLLEIKDTGIGINRFNDIVRHHDFEFVRRTYFLINPNYEVKFGLQPREQVKVVEHLPYFRDFLTTCCYCIIRQRQVTA